MYEIKLNKLGLFFFELKNEKGEILLVSSSYTQKTNCQKGIGSIQRNGNNIDNYIKEKLGYGIKAGNGQIVAMVNSENLKNDNEVQNVIKEIINLSPTKIIKDLTKKLI